MVIYNRFSRYKLYSRFSHCFVLECVVMRAGHETGIGRFLLHNFAAKIWAGQLRRLLCSCSITSCRLHVVGNIIHILTIFKRCRLQGVGIITQMVTNFKRYRLYDVGNITHILTIFKPCRLQVVGIITHVVTNFKRYRLYVVGTIYKN